MALATRQLKYEEEGVSLTTVTLRLLNLNFSVTWQSDELNSCFRLTPAYAFLILFTVGLFGKLGDGPIWPATVQRNCDACVKYWWTDLLYINNLHPSSLLNEVSGAALLHFTDFLVSVGESLNFIDSHALEVKHKTGLHQQAQWCSVNGSSEMIECQLLCVWVEKMAWNFFVLFWDLNIYISSST